MSKRIENIGGYGVGAANDVPGYRYDPVNDVFTDMSTGKQFTKNGAISGSRALYCWKNDQDQLLYTLSTDPDYGYAFQAGTQRKNIDLKITVRVPGTDHFVVQGWDVEYERYPQKDLVF